MDILHCAQTVALDLGHADFARVQFLLSWKNMPNLFSRVNNPSGTKGEWYQRQLCIKPQKTTNNPFHDSLVDNFTLIESRGLKGFGFSRNAPTLDLNS